MNQLVRQLSDGSHPIELVVRPEKSVDALKACLERRYLHIKFTSTRGGTELGVRIDESVSKPAIEALNRSADTIHLVGDLVLDYVPVRCIADIELGNWRGTGHLEVQSPNK